MRPRRLAVPLVVLALTFVTGASVATAADSLLSRGKPATASSIEDSRYTPDKAFDGSTSTRWASREGHDPEWLRVDLGAAASISRVLLRWEVAYAKSYRIQFSADGSTWTTVYSTTSGDGGTDDRPNLSGTGRYVRIYGTQRGTPYGYSLWEVEVYGAYPSEPPPSGTFTVAAAGDIAQQCTASSSSCIHPKTAALVNQINPRLVITMGDNQYDDARLQDFQNYYDKTWGAFKAKTKPSPGNHETYDPAGAYAGYKAYFGAIAYPNGKSYYSYDVGNWHFLALDSNQFDSSTQLSWIKQDLAATTKKCVAAYFHHPLFSSGEHGNNPAVRPVWDALYAARADLVLSGHDHHYERFGPQTPSAVASPDGIVQVIGGMGGAPPYDIVNPQPNSQYRLSGKYGVIKLTFTDSTFSWQLVGVGGTVLDSSPTYSCH